MPKSSNSQNRPKLFCQFPIVVDVRDIQSTTGVRMVKKTRLAIIVLLIITAVSSLHFTRAQTPPNPVELVGSITAMDATAKTITVNGLTIDISQTEVAAGFKLAVGVVIKVEGNLSADGSIAALQINTATNTIQPGEVELVGVVQSLDTAQIVINGQMIDITKAEIGKGVAVGKTVKIHATFGQDMTLVAREVAVFTPLPEVTPEATAAGTAIVTPVNPHEFELTGTLEQIGADFIVVSGQQISTTGAEIKGQLVVGAFVKVHVSNVNNVLTAREVELAQKIDDDVNDDVNDDHRPKATGTQAASSKGDNSGPGSSNSGHDDKGNGSGGNNNAGSGHDDGGGRGGSDDGGGHH
jgi:hypothetical protein